jgi:hypothetical protein
MKTAQVAMASVRMADAGPVLATWAEGAIASRGLGAGWTGLAAVIVSDL